MEQGGQGSCLGFLCIPDAWYPMIEGFPGCSVGKEPACNVGDPGSILGSGRSPGEGHGNSLQYSCLENSVDRGAWRATVHGVAKSQDMTESKHSTAQHSKCPAKNWEFYNKEKA